MCPEQERSPETADFDCVVILDVNGCILDLAAPYCLNKLLKLCLERLSKCSHNDCRALTAICGLFVSAVTDCHGRGKAS